MKIVNICEGVIGVCNNKNKDYYIYFLMIVSIIFIMFVNYVLKIQMRLFIKFFICYCVYVKF